MSKLDSEGEHKVRAAGCWLGFSGGAEDQGYSAGDQVMVGFAGGGFWDLDGIGEVVGAEEDAASDEAGVTDL